MSMWASPHLQLRQRENSVLTHFRKLGTVGTPSLEDGSEGHTANSGFGSDKPWHLNGHDTSPLEVKTILREEKGTIIQAWKRCSRTVTQTPNIPSSAPSLASEAHVKKYPRQTCYKCPTTEISLLYKAGPAGTASCLGIPISRDGTKSNSGLWLRKWRLEEKRGTELYHIRAPSLQPSPQSGLLTPCLPGFLLKSYLIPVAPMLVQNARSPSSCPGHPHSYVPTIQVTI